VAPNTSLFLVLDSVVRIRGGICKVGRDGNADTEHLGPVTQWRPAKVSEEKTHLRDKFPNAGEVEALRAAIARLSASDFTSDANQCILESIKSQLDGITMMVPALKPIADNPEQWAMFRHFVVAIGNSLAALGLVQRHWGIAGSAALCNAAIPFMAMALSLQGDQVRKRYFQGSSAKPTAGQGEGPGKPQYDGPARQPGQPSPPGQGKRWQAANQWKDKRW
jgi:hypothetical protein